jgi:hypothetical protein
MRVRSPLCASRTARGQAPKDVVQKYDLGIERPMSDERAHVTDGTRGRLRTRQSPAVSGGQVGQQSLARLFFFRNVEITIARPSWG